MTFAMCGTKRNKTKQNETKRIQVEGMRVQKHFVAFQKVTIKFFCKTKTITQNEG